MQRKSLSLLPRPSAGQRPRASLLWGVGPPLVQKRHLHLNREAFSPGAQPHLPRDWRVPLCRAPAAKSGAVSPQFQPPLLGRPTLLPPLWLPEIMTVHGHSLLSGMTKGFYGPSPFPVLQRVWKPQK